MNPIDTYDWKRFCDRLTADKEHGEAVMELFAHFQALKAKIAEAEALRKAGGATPQLVAEIEHAYKRLDEARTCVVVANIPLVHYHVDRTIKGGALRASRDDAIQIGLIALMRAVDRFDDRGTKFSTYASVVIINAVIQWAIREAKQLDRNAQLDEDMLSASHSIRDDEIDRLEAHELAVECAAAVIDNECGLDERERDVLILYFGIGDGMRGQRHVLRMIAERYSLSKQGVSNIRDKAMAKVRATIDARRN